jgi:hypothetical protein
MSEQVAADLRRVLDTARLGPRPVDDLRKKAEVIYEKLISLDTSSVLSSIQRETDGGPVRAVMRQQLAQWDFERDAEWTRSSLPSTRARRDVIYEAMALTPEHVHLLDEVLPFFEAEPITVIETKRWERWYSPNLRAAHHYYAEGFSDYLRSTLHWSEESILSLDETTTAVVERLADPTREERHQARGLVVGYVQSGKTANITGVVAKAADAGYRLIVVLAGTQNMLRYQTQRRLDKELLGAEFVEDEYLDDADWDTFRRHGATPSLLGAFDWVRLTDRSHDYRKLPAGAIETLKFSKVDPARAFNDPVNLYRSNAKLLVVKKNAAVLDKLATDLTRVNTKGQLAEVPTLVIDDESDQASVNTIRPPVSGEDATERTRINEAIVELLKMLPRAQYVGYTATPFANVFIDPADAEDLFPKDFIISLPRPPGYLGASDFHDLEGTPADSDIDPFRSNERAYVRPVRHDDVSNERLRKAIDSFVLSGALKLFREKRSDLEFRHHTMMVHTSHLTIEQRQQLEIVRSLLTTGGYQTGESMPRLLRLLEEDFDPVSRSRAPNLPFPSQLSDLDDDLGETISRLYAGGSPALLINSAADADQLAFDAEPVWKIVVGGAKLSRGFTIEGLTVSYFRRTSPTADTLMQMGRWCGFRDGYQDLVRLFIARSEIGEPDGFDVYEAFEAICRDEDSFRGELRRYAMPQDDTDPVTPRDIPPLVASHLDWVRPTSGNKMYNAKIEFRNFGGRVIEHRLAPTADSDIAANEDLCRDLIQRHSFKDGELSADGGTVRAFSALVANPEIVKLLMQYRWLERRHLLAAEIEFLAAKHGDPEIDDWVMIVPQLHVGGAGVEWSVAGNKLSVHLRQRNLKTELVNAYAGPEDRKIAAIITGSWQAPTVVNQTLEALRQPRRAVLLLYPIAHSKQPPRPWHPTIGFTLVLPANHMRKQIGFSVKNPDKADSAIVPEERPDA